MAIPHLTDEQVHTWTREQKDRWWLENVYRGDMAQLTVRSAVTGFVLGGILSATNLYVSAKTGITLGVGLTSVILAYAMFKALSAARLAKDFTILENNAMQSIATSAGYMTVPLMSSFTAYFWKANVVLPWYQIFAFNIVTAVMGVLVAFPMKRRFINDEQQPFPEGRACGVVLDTLYTGGGRIGMIQAKALLAAAGLTSLVQIMAGEAYMKLLQVKLLGRETFWHFNERLDTWYYKIAEKHPEMIPRLGGIDIRELALRPSLDLAMIGTGGLMGVRTSTSMLVGMVINFFILAPWMIRLGDIRAKDPRPGAGVGDRLTWDQAVELAREGAVSLSSIHFGRAEIVNQWSIWWGVGIMVVGSLVALFAKPKVIIDAFRGMFSKKDDAHDVVGHIELPLKISFIGLPICAVITAWMAHTWYQVPYWMTIVALPLVFALSLICTNAMALTSWTPTGALAKIPQFTFGMLDRTNPGVNLMTAGITASVASNAANLLSDIKPGYMLGAKPRQQAVGHVIGILSGAAVSTPLFYAMFLSKRGPEQSVEEAMVSDKFAMPSAVQWKGVADIIEGGFSHLSPSIVWSLSIAAAAALIFEIARLKTKGRFWLSPVSIGLGVVLPPDATLCMWIGSLLFHFLHKRNEKREGSLGHTLWVRSMEPICAGIIAGAALTGIVDKLIDVFVLG
ncbi:MAG: OPT/YSL family transporter [Phycisphaerales bacterium]|nr:OPT/YSL family transporter [Phycisphaerales bacterium]